MKLSELGLFALLTLTPMAFASQHTCECSTSCQQSCAEGKSEQCTCDCGCKETGKCEHGVCHLEPKDKEENKEK